MPLADTVRAVGKVTELLRDHLDGSINRFEFHTLADTERLYAMDEEVFALQAPHGILRECARIFTTNSS